MQNVSDENYEVEKLKAKRTAEAKEVIEKKIIPVLKEYFNTHPGAKNVSFSLYPRAIKYNFKCTFETDIVCDVYAYEEYMKVLLEKGLEGIFYFDKQVKFDSNGISEVIVGWHINVLISNFNKIKI